MNKYKWNSLNVTMKWFRLVYLIRIMHMSRLNHRIKPPSKTALTATTSWYALGPIPFAYVWMWLRVTILTWCIRIMQNEKQYSMKRFRKSTERKLDIRKWKMLSALKLFQLQLRTVTSWKWPISITEYCYVLNLKATAFIIFESCELKALVGS